MLVRGRYQSTIYPPAACPPCLVCFRGCGGAGVTGVAQPWKTRAQQSVHPTYTRYSTWYLIIFRLGTDLCFARDTLTHFIKCKRSYHVIFTRSNEKNGIYVPCFICSRYGIAPLIIFGTPCYKLTNTPTLPPHPEPPPYFSRPSVQCPNPYPPSPRPAPFISPSSICLMPSTMLHKNHAHSAAAHRTQF